MARVYEKSAVRQALVDWVARAVDVRLEKGVTFRSSLEEWVYRVADEAPEKFTYEEAVDYLAARFTENEICSRPDRYSSDG